MIELYPHNEKALKKLKESLQTNSLAFIEHATGTGKSFIMLKYLYEEMRKNRILIVSLHYEMFEQLLGSQMETLGITKDDFNKLDTIIYHNIINLDPKEVINQYDCFIFDEAHHCGAEKWSKFVSELRDLVLQDKNKKMIGFTATGTRYLDNYLDVSSEYFGGNTVSYLGVGEAILRGLLPAPLYINSTSKCILKIDEIEKLLKKVPNIKELDSLKEEVENIKQITHEYFSPKDLFQKYGIKKGEKYVVFCTNINELKLLKQEAKSWFPYEIKMFEAHSEQSHEKNISEIQEFNDQTGETCLMFAVDIFNEGLHLDSLDGIFMFRKTTSPIIYFQQIGRALSFSVRKKRIKIFDMVDNISENDVIDQLYKELILECKKLSDEDKENKELYEEILSRFEVIDNTSSIMISLKKIENYIKEKYIYPGKITTSLLLISEFNNLNPDKKFIEEFYGDRLDYKYREAFSYIISHVNELTVENINTINKLGLTIYGVDLNKIANSLGKYKNLKEKENDEFDSFVSDYISYVKDNDERPTSGELYYRYREYLSKMKKNQLSAFLVKLSLPRTIEETILIGGYPVSSQLSDYLEYLKNKILDSKSLDMVEKKVLNRLKGMLIIKDPVLLEYFRVSDDKTFKLDNAIEKIARYKEKFKNERFERIRNYESIPELFKALSFLHKNAIYITNNQFKRLVELDIALPSKINMTEEERRKKLGSHNSLYELEEYNKSIAINKYISFINKNKRRPDSRKKEEKELVELYEEAKYLTTPGKVKECVYTLVSNDIPLTRDEKIIANYCVTPEIIQEEYQRIKRYIEQNDVLTSKDFKLFGIILRSGNIKPYMEASVLYRSQEFAINFVETFNKIRESERNNFLSKNYKHLSLKMINELIQKGYSIPDSVIEEVKHLEQYRTLYEYEKIIIDNYKDDYIEYVKVHKKRPTDEKLIQGYREYIAGIYGKTLEKILNQVKMSCGYLLPEERLLLGELPDNIDEILISIEEKNYMDKLDKRIYKYFSSRTYTEKVDRLYSKPTVSIQDKTINRLYEDLLEKIKDNPLKDIYAYDEIKYLPNGIINSLVVYRYNILAAMYLESIYDKLKKSKMTKENALNQIELKVLEILDGVDIDPDYKALYSKIMDLDYDNIFYEKDLDYENFIKSYIDFIRAHKGLVPSVLSEDSEERDLAINYENVKDNLKLDVLKLIENTILESVQKEDEDNFFDMFIDFINKYERFPCTNSTSEDEVKLANIFINVNVNKKLSKDQIAYINSLRKKYALSTLKASQEFNKQRKEMNNGEEKETKHKA